MARGLQVLLLVSLTLLPLTAQEVSAPTTVPDGQGGGTAVRREDLARGSGKADRGATNRPAAKSTPALNPLDGYLADWMRPRDRSLLQGAKSPSPSAADSWQRLATSRPATPKAAPSTAKHAANPYIEAMSVPPARGDPAGTQAAPMSGLPTGVAAPPAPASLVEPEAPAPPPPTRYQPPPQSDAKYFPQLKRF